MTLGASEKVRLHLRNALVPLMIPLMLCDSDTKFSGIM